MHYLDHASTTPVAPEVAAEVNESLLRGWANPSALYRAGAEAERAMQAHRAVLAGALGCAPGEVFFTAGGTEANNLAILGAARVRKSWASHLVSTGYEHPAVSGPLHMLAKNEGFTLSEVAPGPEGRVDLAALVAAVGPKTALCCAMQVNNETGATLDVAALAAAVKAKNPRCFVHVDGVQGFCKSSLAPGATKIDGYATSGHKLNAPKGVGALYLRGGGGNFAPPFAGGGQEPNAQSLSIRPGTQSTACIAGYAKAVQLALARRAAEAESFAALRQRLLDGLAALPEPVRIHSPANGAPGILFFSLPAGLLSQTVINYLDEKHNVQVASGSACDKGRPSHTLAAMGVPAQQIATSLRVSFGQGSGAEDVDALLAGLEDALASLARAR